MFYTRRYNKRINVSSPVSTTLSVKLYFAQRRFKQYSVGSKIYLQTCKQTHKLDLFIIMYLVLDSLFPDRVNWKENLVEFWFSNHVLSINIHEIKEKRLLTFHNTLTKRLENLNIAFNTNDQPMLCFQHIRHFNK